MLTKKSVGGMGREMNQVSAVQVDGRLLPSVSAGWEWSLLGLQHFLSATSYKYFTTTFFFFFLSHIQRCLNYAVRKLNQGISNPCGTMTLPSASGYETENGCGNRIP